MKAERSALPGFQLSAFPALPPLMLTDDEAVAVTLGLLVVEQLGLDGSVAAAAGALAKLRRVLPTGLGERVSALAEILVLDLAPAEARVARATLGTLASAAQLQRRAAIALRASFANSYRAGGGATTERAIDPYGLVFHAGRWYTVGHCHLRGEVRVFRLDRIGAATLLEEGFTRPTGFDSKAHLLEAIARIPDIHEASVLLTLDLAEAQRRCPTGLARFEPAPPYVRLRASVDDLGMLARVLAGLGCPLLIEEPEALREALRTLAVNLLRAADARPDGPQQGRVERGSPTHSGADRSVLLVPTVSQ